MISENAQQFINAQPQYRLLRLDYVPVDGFKPQVRHQMRISTNNDTFQNSEFFNHFMDGTLTESVLNDFASKTMGVDISSASTVGIGTGGAGMNDSWSERRFVWYMEIEATRGGSPFICKIIGYTDPTTPLYDGRMDPNVRLHVVNSQMIYTQGRHAIIRENDIAVSSRTSNDINYTVRTSDVANQIALDATTSLPDLGTRFSNVGKVVEAEGRLIRGRESVGTGWLSKFLQEESITRFQNNDKNQTSPAAHYNKVSTALRSNSIKENYVLGYNRIISNEMIENTGTIRLGVLNQALGGTGDVLNPAMSSVVTLHQIKNSSDAFGTNSDSESWLGGTKEVEIAVSLRNAAGYAVMENMLQELSFSWDMLNIPGIGVDYPFGEDLRKYGLSVQSATGWGHEDSMSKRRAATSAIRRILSDVGNIVTSNGTIISRGMVSIDIMGSITVFVQLDGSTEKFFRSPAFGAGLLNSCVSNRSDAVNNMHDNYVEFRGLIDDMIVEKHQDGNFDLTSLDFQVDSSNLF